MNKRQLRQKYDAYVREYNQKLRKGFELDRDLYKELYGDNKWEVAYKQSLMKSGGTNLNKGHALEPMLSYEEFAAIEENYKESGRGAPRVEEYVKAQTIRLTEGEKAATRAALEKLEENWSEVDTTAMPAEVADSMNAFFNMTDKQKRDFLSSPAGELWRAWVFETFDNFSTYFNMNSPKDEVWEI